MCWYSIWHSVWHFMWVLFWHSIWHSSFFLAFYLTYSLTFCLEYYLAFCLAFYLTFLLACVQAHAYPAACPEFATGLRPYPDLSSRRIPRIPRRRRVHRCRPAGSVSPQQGRRSLRLRRCSLTLGTMTSKHIQTINGLETRKPWIFSQKMPNKYGLPQQISL